MSSIPLSARLQALADTYKQTLVLIQQLQNLPSTPTPSSDAEKRLELSSEIHQSLTEQEDSLELLRQDLDDVPGTSNTSSWVGGGSVRRYSSQRSQEAERNAATMARMAEDLKIARASFRRAQLQAKRNADTAKRTERELLFASRNTADGENIAPARRKGQEKVTQDDLALNASQDVTKALQRTAAILRGNLDQSSYAQEMIEEDSVKLASLGESYSGTGDMLKNSRGLVGQLMRSQKSDTWYLETAFLILCVTVGWLIFRRWIYGPAWWLIWQPLRWSWWFLASFVSGVVGLGSPKSAPNVTAPGFQSVGVNSRGMPTFAPGEGQRYIPMPAKGGGWDRPDEPPKQDPPQREEESMVEQIGKMAEQTQQYVDIYGEEISEEEYRRQEEQPRNPKKRMMEQEKEPEFPHNEL